LIFRLAVVLVLKLQNAPRGRSAQGFVSRVDSAPAEALRNKCPPQALCHSRRSDNGEETGESKKWLGVGGV
jgi:hypothetical protein